MKKTLFAILCALTILSLSVLGAFASTESTSGGVEELDITFNPAGFLTNLDKMVFGMIGIFIVVLVVIAITYILNKATSKK